MRIGIFGGSFNPVHNGHLRLAREALSELNLDQVIFVPSYITPLKKKEVLLPSSLRVRLLRSALKAYPQFSVSLCEIKRKGPSFTVDSLKYFKRKFGKEAALFFLAGGDVLANLSRWRSLDEVFRLCRFVVMTRPGYRVKNVPRSVFFLPLDALDISSTLVRRRLSGGKSIRGLVPEEVDVLLRNFRRKKSN